jgi:hypothetical protein
LHLATVFVCVKVAIDQGEVPEQDGHCPLFSISMTKASLSCSLRSMTSHIVIGFLYKEMSFLSVLQPFLNRYICYYFFLLLHMLFFMLFLTRRTYHTYTYIPNSNLPKSYLKTFVPPKNPKQVSIFYRIKCNIFLIEHVHHMYF